MKGPFSNFGYWELSSLGTYRRTECRTQSDIVIWSQLSGRSYLVAVISSQKHPANIEALDDDLILKIDDKMPRQMLVVARRIKADKTVWRRDILCGALVPAGAFICGASGSSDVVRGNEETALISVVLLTRSSVR